MAEGLRARRSSYRIRISKINDRCDKSETHDTKTLRERESDSEFYLKERDGDIGLARGSFSVRVDFSSVVIDRGRCFSVVVLK